jgi:N-acetylglucosamine malate deacetylase 1
MNLDILAFGIHPDDVELSCSGTLLKHKALGYSVGVCDLTRGEMGTRGDGETRKIEAENAAKILTLDVRLNLEMEDIWAKDDKENCLKIVEVIRKYKPKILLCNAVDDRHPDHSKGSDMVKKAAFISGLRKVETEIDGIAQEAYRPHVVYHYIQQYYIKPDLVVDISDYIDTKFKSIMAYSTQFFNPKIDEPPTPISDQKFLDFIKAKDIHMGMNIGVRYGEGFTIDRIIGVDDLTKIL